MKTPAGTLAPTIALPLAAAVMLSATPSRAEACGGMAFESHVERTGGMDGQELFVAVGHEHTTLVFSPSFSETEGEAAYLLPMMFPPDTVAEGDSLLFEVLHDQTAPTIIWDRPADAEGCSLGCSKAGAAEDGAFGGGDDGVDVYAHGTTATYEYAVVGGDDGGEIGEWLADNEFVIPDSYGDELDAYVSGGWVFLVARVQEPASLDAESGATLAPLVLEYPAFPAQMLNMPFGMASHSLAPDGVLGVTLYMLGPRMVVPEEPIATIDENDLVLEDGESNYAELLSRAAHGGDGHAWVLEFSEAGWDPDDRLTLLEGEPGWDPNASEQWLIEFAHGLGVDDARLTRLRTEYEYDELADLDFRDIEPQDVDGTLEASDTAREGAHGLPVLGNMLMLLPLLAVRRRRR